MTEQQIKTSGNLPTTKIISYDLVADLTADIEKLFNTLKNTKTAVDSLLNDCAKFFERKDFHNDSAIKGLVEMINYEIDYIHDLYSICKCNPKYSFSDGDGSFTDLMSIIMYDKNIFYMWIKLFKCINDPRILNQIPWSYFA